MTEYSDAIMIKISSYCIPVDSTVNII